MLEIVTNGTIESDEQVLKLAERYRQVVIPGEIDDLELTHWWVVKEDGDEMLYVGTPDTFTTYIKEKNGGVQ